MSGMERSKCEIVKDRSRWKGNFRGDSLVDLNFLGRERRVIVSVSEKEVLNKERRKLHKKELLELMGKIKTGNCWGKCDYCRVLQWRRRNHSKLLKLFNV